MVAPIDKKTSRIEIRVTQYEKRKIQEFAKSLDMSVADLIRKSVNMYYINRRRLEIGDEK